MLVKPIGCNGPIRQDGHVIGRVGRRPPGGVDGRRGERLTKIKEETALGV